MYMLSAYQRIRAEPLIVMGGKQGVVSGWRISRDLVEEAI